MGYLFLLLTIISETTAVICMKLSNGFENKLQAGLATIAYLASFIFLTLALKHLPAGIANAIWAGLSTLLVAVLGIFIFGEQLNLRQWLFLGLIIVGILGLHLSANGQ